MPIEEVRYATSADSSEQPALFQAPERDEPAPLLVALHTWSGGYRSASGEEYSKRCAKRGWVFIHPDFRGPSRRPEAGGSDLVVQDIVSAVDYARQRANVDPRRIYLAGASGGGHVALLVAGRAPEIWAGVSAWVPISDLAAWYWESRQRGKRYADEVAQCCGGEPGAGVEVDREYEKRSPLTWLPQARGTRLDINAGITDGHTGSVPVDHSLRAFNAVADKADLLSEGDIAYFVEEAETPPHLVEDLKDPTYGDRPPLFRRTSGAARVTLFDGGHAIVYDAAFAWLERQSK